MMLALSNPITSTSSAEVLHLQKRNAGAAVGVTLVHIALIWVAMLTWESQAPEQVIGVEMIAEIIDSPAPAAIARPQTQQTPQKPERPATQPAPPSMPKPAIQQKAATANSPLAAIDAPPAPGAPAGASTPSTAAPAPQPAAASVSAAPPPAGSATTSPIGAQVSVQLPSSNADYLQNPKPPYPSLSARLGETGKVIYKVWIGVDGKAQRAELVSSSGFSRLDKAAYDTVMNWRYVPGKRNGVAEAMPFNVPINWELQN